MRQPADLSNLTILKAFSSDAWTWAARNGYLDHQDEITHAVRLWYMNGSTQIDRHYIAEAIMDIAEIYIDAVIKEQQQGETWKN